jgi:hypothetical protein
MISWRVFIAICQALILLSFLLCWPYVFFQVGVHFLFHHLCPGLVDTHPGDKSTQKTGEDTTG